METVLLIAMSGLGTAAVALRRKAATVTQEKTRQKFINAAVAVEAAQKAIQEIISSGEFKEVKDAQEGDGGKGGKGSKGSKKVK